MRIFGVAILSSALLLGACARPLSLGEVSYLASVHGQNVDYNKVRVKDGGLLTAPTDGPWAVTVGNTIQYDKNYYLDDFAPSPPEVTFDDDLWRLAHEITHVWQYQNKDLTGYSLARIAKEHSDFENPYYYDEPLDPNRKFLSYRLEQQAQIVQDWVEKRALNAPDAKVYERVIRQAMPLDTLLKRAVSKKNK